MHAHLGCWAAPPGVLGPVGRASQRCGRRRQAGSLMRKPQRQHGLVRPRARLGGGCLEQTGIQGGQQAASGGVSRVLTRCAMAQRSAVQAVQCRRAGNALRCSRRSTPCHSHRNQPLPLPSLDARGGATYTGPARLRLGSGGVGAVPPPAPRAQHLPAHITHLRGAGRRGVGACGLRPGGRAAGLRAARARARAPARPDHRDCPAEGPHRGCRAEGRESQREGWGCAGHRAGRPAGPCCGCGCATGYGCRAGRGCARACAHRARCAPGCDYAFGCARAFQRLRGAAPLQLLARRRWGQRPPTPRRAPRLPASRCPPAAAAAGAAPAPQRAQRRRCAQAGLRWQRAAPTRAPKAACPAACRRQATGRRLRAAQLRRRRLARPRAAAAGGGCRGHRGWHTRHTPAHPPLRTGPTRAGSPAAGSGGRVGARVGGGGREAGQADGGRTRLEGRETNRPTPPLPPHLELAGGGEDDAASHGLGLEPHAQAGAQAVVGHVPRLLLQRALLL